MANLKLGPPEDDKPVKLAVELPAALHRSSPMRRSWAKKADKQSNPPSWSHR